MDPDFNFKLYNGKVITYVPKNKQEFDELNNEYIDFEGIKARKKKFIYDI